MTKHRRSKASNSSAGERTAWSIALLAAIGSILLLVGHFRSGSKTSASSLSDQHAGSIAPRSSAHRDKAPSSGRTISIAWGGDTTLGSDLGQPPESAWPLLRSVAPILRRSDLTAVNLEGTLATGGTSKCGASPSSNCFAFRAPPENAKSLRRAGVDVVNVANNHSNDYGPGALAETIAAVGQVKIGTTGRPGEILVREVNGQKVAFIGFAPYTWSAPLNDPTTLVQLVRTATERADLVVVIFHGGAEGRDKQHTPMGREDFFGENRGDVRAFARTAIDAGGDLVLGSGPHVLRGMEIYKDRLIAYSLGNLAGFHNFSTGGVLSLSGILRVRIDAEGKLQSGRFLPLRLDTANIPHRDPSNAASQMVSELSSEDFGASAVTIGPRGRLDWRH